MNRDRSGSASGIPTDLDGPLSPSDRVSMGVTTSTSRNPVQKAGRPDGTVAAELQDPDGFEADDTTVANGWGGKKGPNGDPSVQRTGRPEIAGQFDRGYVVNDRGGAGTPTSNVTSSGGGRIGPA